MFFKDSVINTSLLALIENTSVSFGTSGVRGLVTDFSPEVCQGFTQAFIKTLSNDIHSINSVVVGHDLRPSSPMISAVCIQSLQELGFKGIYVGALPTPAVAFFAAKYHVPAIVVTGSHIPFNRNGIKFYHVDGEITKADEAAILNAEIPVAHNLAVSDLPAIDNSALDSYIERYVNFFGENCLSGMRVAVYEHSSVARDLLSQILTLLGAEVISLDRSDYFVPIDTEAVREEDIARAKSWARQYGFDAIVSTDGDADRPLIGDEHGHWLRGDVVGILCAKYLGADVVVTPVSSNTAAEKSGCFSEVVRTRIGSPYVIEAMQQALHAGAGKVMGFEANGGFLLGSDISHNGSVISALLTRDAVLPMLTLLAMAKESKMQVSQLAEGLPQRFTASDRLQDYPSAQSTALLTALQADFTLAVRLMAPDSGDVVEVNTLDGLRISFANGDIVHLRPSGNAPELRCYAESATPEAAQLLCNNALQRIMNLGATS